MKRLLVAISVTLLIFLLIGAFFAAFSFWTKGNATITVSGTGSVSAQPDITYVRLGVEVVRKSAQRAQSVNASIMRDVISSIEDLGIKRANIETSNFTIWPEVKYDNSKAVYSGYRSSNQLTISVTDMRKVSKVIDAGINAGATNVSGITFDIKDDASYKAEAYKKAVEDANAKADSIAKSAGMKILGIKSITENGYYAPAPTDSGNFKMMAASGETPINSQSLEIKASVTVVYEVQ
jgi:uncharacterized protein